MKMRGAYESPRSPPMVPASERHLDIDDDESDTDPELDPLSWGFNPFRFAEGSARDLGPREHRRASWGQAHLISALNARLGNTDKKKAGRGSDAPAASLPVTPRAAPTLFSKALGVLESVAVDLRVQRPALISFMSHVQASYETKNTHHVNKFYHNWVHACDVLCTSACILNTFGMDEHAGPDEQFAILVASLCHDMDHPGLNNNFLVNTNSALALRYSYVSPLENHSSSLAVAGLRRFRLLAPFSLEKQKLVRDKIIAAILSTDMASHFNLMQRFDDFVEHDARAFGGGGAFTSVEKRRSAAHSRTSSRRGSAGGKGKRFSRAAAVRRSVPEDGDGPDSPKVVALPQYRDDQLKLLCEFTVHCADVSNPGKPWKVSRKWQTLICLEFFEQGDLERASSLPISPNMDRGSTTEYAMANGFILAVIGPLFRSLNRILPRANTAVNELKLNLSKWQAIEKAAVAAKQRESSSADKSPVGTTQLKLA
eukprot:g1614.t1